MYGLDVFQRVIVPGPDVRRLRASTEPGTRLAGELLAHRGPATDASDPGGGLGDAGAVCAVADPDGLTTHRLPVEVCLAPAPPAARPSSTAAPAPASPSCTRGSGSSRWWTWPWTSTYRAT